MEFYGFGASGAVAADAQHKFFRLLLTAAAYSDPHMQAMSAVTLKPGDVARALDGTTIEVTNTDAEGRLLD